MSSSIKTLARYIAYISVAVIVFVSIVMIMNYIQIKKYEPIQGHSIDKLVEKLQASPDDKELREQIRVVDLLSRKAYFTSNWQIKSGGFIILVFIVLFLISIKIYTSKESIESGKSEKLDHFWFIKSKERKWLFISVGILSLVALFLSFNTRKYYTDFTTYVAKSEESKEVTESSTKEIQSTLEQTSTQTTDTASSTEVNKEGATVTSNHIPTEAELKANYPSFRGAFGLGVCYAANTPTQWDGALGKNVIWKKPLDLPGLNSPILWGDFLFIAGANETKRKVYCFDRLKGTSKWTKDVTNIPGSPKSVPKVSNETGFSASGLVTNGELVFAIFATGDLICLNYKGEQVWAKNMGMPDNHYGYSSSLQVYKDKLIIQYDDNKSRKIIALSTSTGKEIWNTSRLGSISWSSPIIVSKGNTAEIIVNNTPYVASYDAETGKENWKTNCLSGEIGPSPAYSNGLVFAANEYAKLLALKDGKVVWEGYDDLPDASSPVAYNDLLFMTNSYGTIVCMNAKDGSVYWKKEFDNGFYGSPVIADGKLYVIDRSGQTIIIGKATLGEKSDCTPAFAKGTVYIRGAKNLFCIGSK